MHYRPQLTVRQNRRFTLVRGISVFLVGGLVGGILGGCSRTEIVAPELQPVGQFTVDASTAWAYVDLATGETTAQTDASSSTTWDIGFNATTVELNGGDTGPAGVTGFCLCQNSNATDAAVLQMTPSSEEPAFSNTTSAAIPADETVWSSDVFATDPWYRYDLAGDHRISPTFNVYLVRRGAAVYKLQLIDYYGPAGETRRISVRYSKVRG